MALESTQLLTEISTRIISWQPYNHPLLLSWNLGTLISWNPLFHSRPLKGLLYIYIYLHEKPSIKKSSTNGLTDEEIMMLKKIRMLGSGVFYLFSRLWIPGRRTDTYFFSLGLPWTVICIYFCFPLGNTVACPAFVMVGMCRCGIRRRETGRISPSVI